MPCRKRGVRARLAPARRMTWEHGIARELAGPWRLLLCDQHAARFDDEVRPEVRAAS